MTAALLLLSPAAGSRGAAAAASRDGAAGSAVQRRAARGKVRKKMSGRRTDGRVEGGSWGGQHVRMNVDEGGADLDFDCARGRIGGPLKTDAEGRFDLPGTYTREGPGPIRLNRLPQERPARYTGRVEGSRMTLSVRLEGSEESPEEFTLTRGSGGRVVKCR